jgi:hypothetical protein
MEFFMFTPGPWDVGRGMCHDVYAPKRDGHQQKIAICPTQSGARDYDSIQCAANAKLIAAAPDLYANADLIARIFAGTEGDSAFWEAFSELLSQRGLQAEFSFWRYNNHSTLAKAKGESKA